MAERLKNRVGTTIGGVRRGAAGAAGLMVRREEYPCGRVTWDVRGAPLVAAMIVAAVAGFAVAANLTGGDAGDKAPAAKIEVASSAPPERLLQIQVRADAPARPDTKPGPPLPTVLPPETSARTLPPPPLPPLPAPPARPAVMARTEPVPVPVRSAPAAGPVLVARAEPAVVPARPAAPPAAAVAAPLPPVQAPPAQIARVAPPPEPARAIPYAQPQAWPDQDPEVLAADRELAAAYREAGQAGVSGRELRVDQQAWRSARAVAASRSRGALLNAYRDHIDDLHDLIEEAEVRRQDQERPQDRYADPYPDRYSQNPRGYYPPGYY